MLRLAVAAVAVGLGTTAVGAAGVHVDAGRIAFSLDRDGISRMYTIRPDGTGLRRLTIPPTRQLLGGDSGPVWSPDGRRIAFERDLPYWGQDRFRLYVIGSAGGEAVPLTSGPFDVEPSWSPDGTRIAFVRGAGSTAALATAARAPAIASRTASSTSSTPTARVSRASRDRRRTTRTRRGRRTARGSRSRAAPTSAAAAISPGSSSCPPRAAAPSA